MSDRPMRHSKSFKGLIDAQKMIVMGVLCVYDGGVLSYSRYERETPVSMKGSPSTVRVGMWDDTAQAGCALHQSG